MNDWPSDYWKLGAVLLHQQCWQFGRDISSPYGNLLLEAGFEHSRPPVELRAGSRYTRQRDGEPALCLWAFGVFAYWPERGGIYINRYQFVPHWVGEPELAAAAWKPSVFEASRPPMTYKTIRMSRQLIRFIVGAFAEYEDMVLTRYGISYRRETLSKWHAAPILPCRLPAEWRRLSWHVPDPPVKLWPATYSSKVPAGTELHL